MIPLEWEKIFTLFTINILQCKHILYSKDSNKYISLEEYLKHLHTLNIDWKYCSKITPKFGNTIIMHVWTVIIVCQEWSLGAVPPGMDLRGCPTFDGH